MAGLTCALIASGIVQKQGKDQRTDFQFDPVHRARERSARSVQVQTRCSVAIDLAHSESVEGSTADVVLENCCPPVSAFWWHADGLYTGLEKENNDTEVLHCEGVASYQAASFVV
uniref:Uncharacterized protein n=1 Tax=Eutreptiella gymnastica TaxID=73025 RepID=A0A7S4CX48_9EUGL|mmetsp:Transcript_70811/g.118426  ORF Transcript_70811/g.118426 Transcript_70811/m.118426 type:complete len:115 (+) Transcript_70811:450-794(+)